MNTSQKRRKDTGEAGNGGQYAALARGEAAVQVTPQQQSRFIEDPEIARTARQWWSRAAELTDQSGRVPTIGRETGGPVRRSTYRGKDYSITMPSSAAVHRFSRTVAERTGDESRPFEMPLEYTGPDGRSVMTAVRVSRRGKRFEVQMPSGFPADRKVEVSESLRTALESRRPTLTTARTRDLVSRYRERAARSGVQTREVASSFIKSIGYDPESGKALVVMKKPSKNNPSGAYEYEVSPEQWREFMAEKSVGRGYANIIKGRGKKPTVYAEQCPKCDRYFGAATKHECPVSV